MEEKANDITKQECGHFIEPVTLRKTRRRSHCSSNVWEEHCHIVIIRHITFARHWWSEWKCALFCMGTIRNLFLQWRRIPAKDEITPVGDDRYAWGTALGLISFPSNGGGTFNGSLQKSST
ncbi:hypothetical protein Q3G72_014889 [Acer saccharum]|nr:hypothetical protein Q3G72_014889 [Acer saccharum]